MDKGHLDKNHPALKPYIDKAKELLANEDYEELLIWRCGCICACKGPTNDDPLCGCRMRQLAAVEIAGVRVLLKKIEEQKKPKPEGE